MLACWRVSNRATLTPWGCGCLARPLVAAVIVPGLTYNECARSYVTSLVYCTSFFIILFYCLISAHYGDNIDDIVISIYKLVS